MTVEIISYSIQEGIVFLGAIDVSEENLQRLERIRTDLDPEELIFRFDTHNPSDYDYLHKWLKRQKSTKEDSNWGESIRYVVGTVTTINYKYWDRNCQ